MSERLDMAARVATLKAEGLNGLQIAARLQISRSYAYELINDPEGEAVRARKDSYRGTCKTCGARTDGSSGKAGAPDECHVCVERRHEERRARILRMWERGYSAKEIAACEGTTQISILSLVDKRRRLHGASVSRRRRAHRELWPEIERLWRDGAATGDIAAAVETTPGNVTQMIQVMRRNGIDLPYRRRRTRVTA